VKAESGERTIPRGVRIRAEGLTQLARGGAVLLDGVSLVVEPGELVAIAGGSGAGKTTLLEILAGVRAPSEGRVPFDEADVHRQAEAVRPLLGLSRWTTSSTRNCRSSGRCAMRQPYGCRPARPRRRR
jgi:ABC-type transport system involved in cytochrome bd biosynthesis fused ATPase/permease subunit